MPVRIELSPFLRKHVPEYDPAEGLVVESGHGKTISQLIEELGIPPKKVNSIMVNHFPARANHIVKDGDVIGLIMAIGGG
jgi:sulfur carrier protein ThiS